MKKLQWISWHQPTDDHRPLTFPPNEAIVGWWCSGHSERGATLCALVIADNERAAQKAVKIDWPEAAEWRFCEERVGVNLGDRFRPHGWMIPRFEALKD